jgi:nucleoid DNA-binding protein
MTREEFIAAVAADPAPVIAKYADEIADAVMASIARAGIDQGQEISLDARSLFVAVRSGVARYLTDEIEKCRTKDRR